jgi:hypothetical protein
MMKYLMNHACKTVCLTAVALLLTACGDHRGSDSLETQFATPPETIQVGVYWYWINDNITKEGVVKDLQAMKQAGINSAFIGNIGNQGYPYGSAPVFSDEWWDILHTTFKTAAELGIEIGMFNCPGWSHTGGPWVKPEQAMRYLASSETRVAGPGQVNIQLPVPSASSHLEDWEENYIDNEGKPAAHFQDVKVLAFPISKNYREDLLALPGVKSTVSKVQFKAATEAEAQAANRPVSFLARPTEASPNYPRHTIQARTEYAITYKLPQPQDVRSIFIYPSGHVDNNASLQAKIDGAFVTVDSFHIRNPHPIPAIGYAPYAPFAESFTGATSDEFRLVIYNNDKNEPTALGKIAFYSTPALASYAEKSLARMADCNPAWTEYKWTQQSDIAATEGLPTVEQVIDITDKMAADGTLTWDVPEGEWLVFRMGMIPHEAYNSPSKPEDQGYELDKMSAEHIPYHFDQFIGEVLRKIPAEDRPTFKNIIADSWEKGGTLFTDDFLEKMKARYGYDATPFMPAQMGHVVGSPDMTERYLWDARRLAAELLAETFVPGLNESYHKHGLYSWMENYGDWGFPGEFLLYGKYMDKIGGEFWQDGFDTRYIQVAASAAHIYNKKQVYAESFTGGWPFKNHPHTLKPCGDVALAAGMNSSVLHVYIEQAYDSIYPGIAAWFGTEFNRKNTWFSQIDQFVTYLKRCEVMLQQGLNKADIAYFLGEDVPVNSGPFGLDAKAGKPGYPVPLLPKGYQFDYVNSDVILNGMKVKDGLLTLPHGTSYKILVLPPSETMRPELLKKIEQLVADGAVVLGSAPLRSPSLQGYPEADKQVKEIADKLWGNSSEKQRKYGKGLVISDTSLDEALQSIGLKPDCHVDYDRFVFNHRVDAGKDIYFIANYKDSTVTVTPEFRVSGKLPELWNPVTGEIRPLPAYEQRGDVTAIPLQMEGNESMFIVFRKAGKPETADLSANFPQPKEIADLSGPWTVKFDSDKVFRGPAEPVVFQQLEDWAKNADERIRYYSGTAVYNCTFTVSEIPEGKKLYLDLGLVKDMAKIKINGQYAGGVWTPPYRVDVTSLLKAGENTVEAEVVNVWANRLIGDQYLPKEKRMVDSPFSTWRTTSEIQESGLIGPVKIVEL